LSSPCIPSLVLCITCLVPALYPLLSCIPCLGSTPQYILCAYSVHSFQVCITSTSILASLRCTCFVIARQILSTPCRHSGQTPHRPSRTLRPTDRNTNRHFWPVLENRYGNLGVIPGTDTIVRDFYYTHYLAHEWPQIAAIPQLRSL
jgi:hypothetical protein